MPARRATFWIAVGCFFASGAAGLLYQLCWIRELRLVFGSTLLSIATVVTAFMGGLGFGAVWCGRRADRSPDPLRLYAGLEALIAAYGLATPWLFAGLRALFTALPAGWITSPWTGAAWRSAAALLLLTPPTLLMGATLPVMIRAFCRRDTESGKTTGVFYGVNTLGGVAGILLAAYLALPAWGVQATIWLAAGLNGLAALGAWGARAPGALPSPAEDAGGAPSPAVPGGRLVLGLAALSGFGALAAELVWTRLCAWVMGDSVYTLAFILAAYLLGLALGSLAYRAWLDRRLETTAAAWGWLAGLEMLVAVTVLLLVPVFNRLPLWYEAVDRQWGDRFAVAQLLQGGLVLACLLIPTAALGAIFPLCVRVYAAGRERVGAGVGRVYAANTVGTIAGSWCAGFLLLPRLGVGGSLLVIAGSAVAVAVAAAWRAARQIPPRVRLALPALLVGNGLLLATLNPGLNLQTLDMGVYIHGNIHRTPPGELVFFREGMYEIVSVYRSRNAGLVMKLGGKVQSSSHGEMTTNYLLAYLPALFSTDPDTGLVIGLGSGASAGCLEQVPGMRRVDVAEIEPEVVPAARLFEAYNHRFHLDPRTRLHFGDARYLTATLPDRYAIIASEPANLWSSSSSPLFTREALQAYRERLAPGGVLCQWVLAHHMTLDDFQVFLHTFHAVFPHVQVYGYHPGMLLFLGSETPLRLQPDRLAALRAQPGIAQDLVRIGMTDPAAILGGLLLDTGLVAELSAGARTNTDDRPWLEFSTPRALHLPGVRARVEAFLGDRGPLPGFLTAQGVAEPDVRVATFYQAAFRQHLDRVEALLPRYLEDGPLSGSLLPVLRRAYWDQGAQRRYYDLVKQLQAGAGGDPGLLLMEQVMTGMTLWEGGGMPDPSERALLRQELLALIHRAGEVGLQLTNREEILQKLARDPALPPESP